MLLIKIIHLIIVISILIIPFLKKKKYNIIKFGYLFSIPLLWSHWFFLQEYCSLTVIDNYLSGKDPFKGNSFITQILKPIFLLPKNSNYYVGKLIWFITILLWCKIIYYFIKNDFKELKIIFKRPNIQKAILDIKIIKNKLKKMFN